MKKYFTIFILICFSTNVIAEVIIMKCNKYRYKYVSSEGVTNIFSANIKRDKKVYHKFCPTEINSSNNHFAKSIDGVDLTISDYQAICFTKKVVMINGGIGTESTSITDFKKLKRSSNYTWNGKKQSESENCRLEKN